MSDQPVIAIVIPAFGHPRFLAEAIISACEQDYPGDVKIVVIDDGCRFDETRVLTQSFMSRYPGQLFYVRQANTRLPGARNAGVRFMLERFPQAEAFFFLDADNRLQPHSISRFYQILGKDPRIGWAYPDIGFFGMTEDPEGWDVRSTAPDYSILKHLVGNVSEAGSLVRSAVFRNGIYYNEDMVSGFEDWDFWLSCLEGGYRGVAAPGSGFMYRRRPESMLADANRQTEFLIQTIRNQHKNLYNRASVLMHLEKEAPPIAFLFSDGSGVVLTLDPWGEGKLVSRAEWLALCADCLRSPSEFFFPERLVLIDKSLWSKLLENKRAIRQVLWTIWQDCPAVTRLELLGPKGVAGSMDYMSGRAYLDRLSIVSTNGSGETESNQTGQQKIHRQFFHTSLVWDVLLGDDSSALNGGGLDWTIWFDPTLFGRHYVRSHARQYGGPSVDAVLDILYEGVLELGEGERPFPCLKGAQRTAVALSSDILFRGELEAIILSYLRTLAEQDGALCLILELTNPEHKTVLSAGLDSIFDEIYVLDLTQFNQGGNQYSGRFLNMKLSLFNRAALSHYIQTIDKLVALPSSATCEVFGIAKHHGAQTAVLIDPVLFNHKNETENALTRVLAFEHSLSHILTNVPAIRHRLVGEGVPAGKVLGMGGLNTVPADKGQSRPAHTMPKGWRPKYGFVFIVTYGRSGSTLLQRLLQSIDGCLLRGENLNMLEPMVEVWSRAGSLKHHADMSHEIGPDRPWYGANNVRPDLIKHDLVDMFIRQVLKPSPDHTRIGFKEIRYTDMEDASFFQLLEFMRDAFAPAKFIFNKRSVSEISQSSWWKTMNEGEVCQMIENNDNRFDQFGAQYPGDCLAIDFQDYRSDIEKIRAIFEFLNAPFDEKTVKDILSVKLIH